MKKILVFIGSRANWGRLKAVCKEIYEHPQLELQLVVGASGLWCDIPYPHERIECLLNSDTKQGMSLTMSVLQMQITPIFKRLKPNYVLVHGDRYEVLAVATAAAYLGIPLAHTEGGEKTGCIDDKVRNCITSLADIHFPVTEKARVKLIDMEKEETYVVGSTALDTLKNIDLSNNRNKEYILVLHHPNTTKNENIKPLIEAVKRLPYNIVWVNPNIDAGNKEMLKQIHKLNVEFVKDLPVEEYLRLLANCKIAIGNSSSFIKEGAYLGTPAIIVGDRQCNREHSENVIFTDYQNINYAINMQLARKTKYPQSFMFGDGNASKKIVEVLLNDFRCDSSESRK